MFCELVGNLNAKLLPGNDFCFCLPPMDPVLCWRLRMEYLNGYWLFKIVKFGSGGLGHCGLVWAPVNSLKSIFAFCGNERECVSLFDTHFLSLTRLLIRVSWEDTSKIVGNTITLPRRGGFGVCAWRSAGTRNRAVYFAQECIEKNIVLVVVWFHLLNTLSGMLWCSNSSRLFELSISV